MVQQPALPLWRQVVFVDWHGVLSRSPYWASIVTDARHPLYRPLRARLGGLYSDPVLFTEWMTGRRSSADVIKLLGVEGGSRHTPDYLLRHLEHDCRLMTVHVELARLLRRVRDRAFVVVATDNIDCFAATFRRLLARRRPDPLAATPPPQSLAAWATSFDDLVCSSEVGTLKARDARAFFGPYLSACGLTFRDALLIDDRSDNCAAFRAAGGATLRWTMHADPLMAVERALDVWLGSGSITRDVRLAPRGGGSGEHGGPGDENR